GTQRLLYCMESPEVWFENFGTAKLKRGRVVVKLDADFAKVIKRGDYRVFPAPEGDCRGLYVRARATRASRCASSWAASRVSPFLTVWLGGARTSKGTAASPKSTRGCRCLRW